MSSEGDAESALVPWRHMRLTASVTMLVVPLPEPARPARNRNWTITGATTRVPVVTASGENPRVARPTAIFVCPSEAR